MPRQFYRPMDRLCNKKQRSCRGSAWWVFQQTLFAYFCMVIIPIGGEMTTQSQKLRMLRFGLRKLFFFKTNQDFVVSAVCEESTLSCHSVNCMPHAACLSERLVQPHEDSEGQWHQADVTGFRMWGNNVPKCSFCRFVLGDGGEKKNVESDWSGFTLFACHRTIPLNHSNENGYTAVAWITDVPMHKLTCKHLFQMWKPHATLSFQAFTSK